MQGHHQMVNTKIRLIIFFADKDGDGLYGQQKWYWELTVAQIMNSLLQNFINKLVQNLNLVFIFVGVKVFLKCWSPFDYKL